jgi:ubiquinone/menaquinone biosynthesis C-methylase UbiE
VQSVPGLGPDSRVIDVGSGTGCLIPHLQRRGVRDILAVDVSPGMLATIRERYGASSALGNEPGARLPFTPLPPS